MAKAKPLKTLTHAEMRKKAGQLLVIQLNRLWEQFNAGSEYEDMAVELHGQAIALGYVGLISNKEEKDLRDLMSEAEEAAGHGQKQMVDKKMAEAVAVAEDMKSTTPALKGGA